MNGSRHWHFNERVAVVMLWYSAVVLPTFASTSRPQSDRPQVTTRVSTRSLEASTPPVGPASVMIEQVRATPVGQSVQVRIVGNAPLSCAPFRLNDPDRVVLDCAGAHLQNQWAPIQVDLDPVRAIRVSQFKADVARVVIDLQAPLGYTTSSAGDTLVVTFQSVQRPPTDAQSGGSAAELSPPPARTQVEPPDTSTPKIDVDASVVAPAEVPSANPVSALISTPRQETVATPPAGGLLGEPNNNRSRKDIDPKVETPPTTPEQVVSDREYVIGSQDLLAVNVWRDPELSRSVPVRPDGKISLPLIGEIVASGLTPDSLQHLITQGLDAYIRNPQVTVIVQEANSHKFYIIGEVERPGAYPLATRMTVLDALASAGGFRDFAKTQQIYLLRPLPNGARQRIGFNYKAAVRGNNSYHDIELQTGDTLVVP